MARTRQVQLRSSKVSYLATKTKATKTSDATKMTTAVKTAKATKTDKVAKTTNPSKTVKKLRVTESAKHRQDELRKSRQAAHYAASISDLLAAIYYDINRVCITYRAVRRLKRTEFLPFYKWQFEQADKVVRIVANLNVEEVDPCNKKDTDVVCRLDGIDLFTQELGWKMLAICAFSDGFRIMCRDQQDIGFWEAFIDACEKNALSLGIFARSRNLDWRGLLSPHLKSGIVRIKNALAEPPSKLTDMHPHQIVRQLDGTLAKTHHDKTRQINTENCIFDPEKFTGEDPTIRTAEHGSCDLCGSDDPCDCLLDGLAGTLVELVEYPDKGVGIRSLTKFKKGDILGEYTGEIRPENYLGDPVYSLNLIHKNDQHKSLALISAVRYGNWTRFISHSCNSSTKFECRTIGKRIMMTVEAARDIGMFEEITIDYGLSYWTGIRGNCRCGESDCISKEA
ncbi:SET domain protein [Aspergillus candidus]|uniref:SET domain-containing protein n=1 Tax=Aspergillus candidus TaxID=41067 RepID=A0A2I2FK47_ASPCN|nr:SET domain-containing protein [Aspergillus candidus]PLB40993.1 SET domain-containing protein [Aspergillus candidus]